jgi:hypothetical protein
VYSVNPAALTQWPEPLVTTYDYLWRRRQLNNSLTSCIT